MYIKHLGWPQQAPAKTQAQVLLNKMVYCERPFSFRFFNWAPELYGHDLEVNRMYKKAMYYKVYVRETQHVDYLWVVEMWLQVHQELGGCYISEIRKILDSCSTVLLIISNVYFRTWIISALS